LFVVQNAGNVGIGTTTPASKLMISGESGTGSNDIGIYSTTANRWWASRVDSVGSYQIRDATAGADRLTVDINGNVGIGTTSPDMLLSVGSATPVGSVAHFENSTGSCYINPTGTSLTCNSDARLKTNVSKLSDSLGLAALMQLDPVTFNWIRGEATGTPTHTGFIAQEVQRYMPDLITEASDGYLSMNYAGLTPYLVKALQEVNLNIETIASTTASSTPASRAFAESFFSNLFSRVSAWLGDAGNGIASVFATTITAVNVNTETLTTKKLCVADDSGAQTCLTKSQLDSLLGGVGAAPSSGGSTGGNGSGGGSTGTESSGSSSVGSDAGGEVTAPAAEPSAPVVSTETPTTESVPTETTTPTTTEPALETTEPTPTEPTTEPAPEPAPTTESTPTETTTPIITEPAPETTTAPTSEPVPEPTPEPAPAPTE
jgi:hypothetical protein